MIGQTVSHCEILEKLDGGGTGVVSGEPDGGQTVAMAHHDGGSFGLRPRPDPLPVARVGERTGVRLLNVAVRIGKFPPTPGP